MSLTATFSCLIFGNFSQNPCYVPSGNRRYTFDYILIEGLGEGDPGRFPLGKAVVLHRGVSQHHGIVVWMLLGYAHYLLDRRRGEERPLEQPDPAGAEAHGGRQKVQVGERQGQVHKTEGSLLRS